MSVFLDTNILAYLFDDDEVGKQATARELLLDLSVPAYVSMQVLIELHAVLTRKLRVSRLDAARVIESMNYPVVSMDEVQVARAAHTATEHSLSIFDA
ncbi:PIN domain-containing protein [Ruania alba]|uniref:PIN domain-containing protein n=1 Tax=Ruania alba TaxID=648782 RepID=UPI000B7DC8B4|nr:PIN domain-containing protein [Ruania alba]